MGRYEDDTAGTEETPMDSCPGCGADITDAGSLRVRCDRSREDLPGHMTDDAGFWNAEADDGRSCQHIEGYCRECGTQTA